MRILILRAIRFSSLIGIAAVTLASSGCMHRGQTPGAATPVHGPDGVIVSTMLDAAAAMDSVAAMLPARGYALDPRSVSHRRVRTRPRRIGGDTSIVLAAEAIPVDLPDAKSIVSLSATYSVTSLGIRDVQVVYDDRTTIPLWERLREVADALRHVSAHR